MDIGVLLPTGTAQWEPGDDPRGVVALALRAERIGFSSLFVNDSLISPRIEALTMLAALAPATAGVTLGTGALLPFMRRPVQAAQSLASIDVLSGGRLVVAVGAGFPGRFGRPMYTLSELPWERRFQRLDETVALWRAVWAGASSFHGELVRFDDLPPATKPFRPEGPPIWLGGATPAALARTAKHYDGWLPYPPDPADYRSGLTAIQQTAQDEGRSADAVTPALFVTVRVDTDEAAGRAQLDLYARANYGMPLADLQTIQAVVTGTADQVAAGLGAYIAAGARHLVLRLGAIGLAAQEEQLDRVAALIGRLADCAAWDLSSAAPDRTPAASRRPRT
ncbi:Luciferase-like monooxygenase [Catenulispora acidiphila DSM 44928]|uniref:Luciferase-like monooxygenase n=1 Tax=Catenulispora acidiphila (strain DSM 44928 / JCM 14897 / NBRC 102108 / NRRL B-24433 / ID139908) TaxID=479433 RepID=C7Q3S4_CATAD|nr:LLM class flavin-dependent oxidoreductase [Catenulispora acidiphila]ACU77682.1 Luciferase-like monooxygenase [Catenulispora acidiphila DSM 44928]